MSAPTTAARGRPLLLTGEVAGARRAYPLAPGRNRIGRAADNDVVLPLPGVSKHHAVLSLEKGMVTVEDLLSKNGTYVNDEPVGTAAVTTGDALRLGPAHLVLGEADDDEGRVVELTTSRRRRRDEGSRYQESTRPAPPRRSGDDGELLALADGFIQRLESEPPGQRGMALAFLAAGAEADGAALLALGPGGVTLVPAAYGAPPAALQRTFAEAAAKLPAGRPPPVGKPPRPAAAERPPGRGTVARPGRFTAAVAPDPRSAGESSRGASGGGGHGDPGSGDPAGGDPAGGHPVVLQRHLDDGRYAALALAGGAGEVTAIALWGAAAPRAGSAALLRLLARLGVAGQPPGPGAAGAGAAADAGARGDRLTFPPAYVPGTSPAMAELYRRLRAVAPSDLPILLLGETGVGKEALARTVHLSSRRASGPFLAINCAAIPAELLEAELFGIRQGVATGVSARPGRLVEASGGTLFLDEIGEMPTALQSKLLRALEEKEAQPVGGSPVAADVRVVAATNADLGEKLEGGRFRPDLYYRLAGCVLTVPPLRHRRQDIPALVEHFLTTFATEAGIGLRGITAGALEELAGRTWPGNVRQLANELRQRVYLCRDSELITRDRLGEGSEAPAAAQPPPLGEDLDLARLERRAIEEALRRTSGHLTRAASMLGISRHTLRRRLKRFGIDRGQG